MFLDLYFFMAASITLCLLSLLSSENDLEWFQICCFLSPRRLGGRTGLICKRSELKLYSYILVRDLTCKSLIPYMVFSMYFSAFLGLFKLRLLAIFSRSIDMRLLSFFYKSLQGLMSRFQPFSSTNKPFGGALDCSGSRLMLFLVDRSAFLL